MVAWVNRSFDKWSSALLGGGIYTHLVLSHQARSARTKRISYFDDLYEYADSAHGAFELDRAITNVDVGCLSRILHGYLVHLNNRSSTNDIDGSSRWDAAINFVRRTIKLFGSGYLAEAARVTTTLEELKYQYGALRPLTRKKPLMPRALRSPIVRNSTLNVYKGLSHGLCTVNADIVNPDLLAFFKT